MLVDVDHESITEFLAGNGVVDAEVGRVGCANTQQTVTLTSASAGTFTLSVGGVTSAAIAFDATAATVKTALAAVVGLGNVDVTGAGGGPWTVTFAGALAAQSIAAMVAADVDLEGEGHGVAVAVTAVGNAVGYVVKKHVTLHAATANSGTITVGATCAGAATGFVLTPGLQSPPIYVDNVNKVYVIGSTPGQAFSWIAC